MMIPTKSEFLKIQGIEGIGNCASDAMMNTLLYNTLLLFTWPKNSRLVNKYQEVREIQKSIYLIVQPRPSDRVNLYF